MSTPAPSSGYDPCENSTSLSKNFYPDYDVTLPSEGMRSLEKAILGLGLGVVVVCFAIWLTNKNKYEQTRIRPSVLVALTCIASIFDDCLGPIAVFTHGATPCWIGLILTSLIIPLMGGSFIARLLIFLFYSRFSRAAAERMNVTHEDDEREEAELQAQSRAFQNRIVLWVAIKAIFLSDEVRTGTGARRTAWEKHQNLVALKFITSRQGVFSMVGILMSPFLVLMVVLIFSDPVFFRGCTGCALSGFFLQMLIAISIIVLVVAVFLAVKVRAYKDNWGLARENSLTLIGALIAFIGFLMIQFLPTSPSDVFTAQLVLSLGFWICVVTQTILQLYLARRNELRLGYGPGGGNGSNRGGKYKITSLTDETRIVLSSNAAQEAVSTTGSPGGGGDLVEGNGAAVLERVLKDEGLLKLFEQHLINEFAVESLLFVKDYREWKKSFPDVSDNTRRARAKRIYNNYLKANALYQINVPDEIYQSMEATLAKEGVLVPVTLFDHAAQEVLALLRRGALMRFVKTNEYNDYMRGGGG